MYSQTANIHDRLEDILESINRPLEGNNEIPWKAIYGLRNIISHEYSNIDEELIISVVNNDVPSLKTVIESLLIRY